MQGQSVIGVSAGSGVATAARVGRAALALSLAALWPGLGHLTLGKWVTGGVLMAINLTAFWLAGAVLAQIAPAYASMTAAETAEILSGDQLLLLTGITGALIGCIFYSVRDVRRLLRQRDT